MLKIISNRPWLLVIGFFTGFVCLWIAFITFAVKHQPQQVPLVTREAAVTDAGH